MATTTTTTNGITAPQTAATGDPVLEISLTGRVLDNNQRIVPGPISIKLDDQQRKNGTPVSLAVLKKLVTDFNNQESIKTGPANQKVAYIINKQLLQILLSSKDCVGLLLCKCLRDDDEHPGEKVESIAFMAVGADRIPVGAQLTAPGAPATLLSASSDVPAGEWIQGLTVAQQKEIGIIDDNNIEGNNFKVDKYFDTLLNKANLLL